MKIEVFQRGDGLWGYEIAGWGGQSGFQSKNEAETKLKQSVEAIQSGRLFT